MLPSVRNNSVFVEELRLALEIIVIALSAVSSPFADRRVTKSSNPSMYCCMSVVVRWYACHSSVKPKWRSSAVSSQRPFTHAIIALGVIWSSLTDRSQAARNFFGRESFKAFPSWNCDAEEEAYVFKNSSDALLHCSKLSCGLSSTGTLTSVCRPCWRCSSRGADCRGGVVAAVTNAETFVAIEIIASSS